MCSFAHAGNSLIRKSAGKSSMFSPLFGQINPLFLAQMAPICFMKKTALPMADSSVYHRKIYARQLVPKHQSQFF
jgi:hypothetical protein